MLNKIRSTLQDEKFQRAALSASGMVVTFVATQVFARLMTQGIDIGIDALMAKIHPTVETPAG